MSDIETIEKLLQDYPFHQYPQTNEHLEGDVRRFLILRDQILDHIASNISYIGTIMKMPGKSTKTLPSVYPSNRLPEIYQIHNDGSWDIISHNSTFDLSRDDQKKLINAVPEEFFNAYFQYQAQPFFDNVHHILTTANSDKTKTICFIVRRCFFVVKKMAKQLKAMGFTCVLINIEQLTNIEDYKDSFDLIVSDADSYIFVQKLMDVIKADVYWVQSMMWDYVLARLVEKKKQDARLVCEFYDITMLYAEKDNLKTLWPDKLIEADFHYGKFIFDEADLIFARFDPSIIHEYLGYLPDNYSEIQPTKCPDVEVIDNHPGFDPANINLVYLGNMIPRNSHHPEALFPLWGMPEAWEKLLNQGFHLHIYNSPFRSNAEDGMSPIIALANTYKNLHFHEGVPHNQIIQEIGKYDFGLILSAVNMETNLNGPLLWKGAVGTKFFTMIESGLPIIIMKEKQAKARFIEKNKMGLSFHTDEHDQIMATVLKANYDEMRNNVQVFNETQTFDKYNKEVFAKLNAIFEGERT